MHMPKTRQHLLLQKHHRMIWKKTYNKAEIIPPCFPQISFARKYIEKPDNIIPKTIINFVENKGSKPKRLIIEPT